MFGVGVPIGGIVGAVGGMIQAKQNYEYSRALNQQQFELQQKLQSQQNEWDLAQWNRENEYNSASAQVQRLRDAGLNVGMMMSGQSAGSASSLVSADPSVPSSAQADFSRLGDSMISGLNAGLQADVANKELQLRDKLTSRSLDQVDKKIEYEREKALSEIGLNEIIGREKEQQIHFSKEQENVLRTSVVQMNKSIDLMDKQMSVYDADIEEKKALAYKAKQEGNMVQYNAITQRMNAVSQRMQARVSSRLADSQIKVNDSVVNLNKKQAEHWVQQIENLKTTNALNKVELEWKGKMYSADFEMKQGQLRLVRIEGDIADATQYAAIADAYIGTVDHVATTVSDCAGAFIDVSTAGATTVLKGQGAVANQSAQTGMYTKLGQQGMYTPVAGFSLNK